MGGFRGGSLTAESSPAVALNEETNLMVLDENVGRQMGRHLLRRPRHSEEITLERFRERSWIECFVETAANLITRLL
jgi:hypothetical protein